MKESRTHTLHCPCGTTLTFCGEAAMTHGWDCMLLESKPFCILNTQNCLTCTLPLVFAAPKTARHQLHIFIHQQPCSNHCTTTKSRSGQGQHVRMLYSSSTGCLAWFSHECMLRNWPLPLSFTEEIQTLKEVSEAENVNVKNYAAKNTHVSPPLWNNTDFLRGRHNDARLRLHCCCWRWQRLSSQ